MPNENQDQVKYPECVVQLSGVSGNSVAIFRTVRKGIIKYLTDEKGWSREDAVREGDAFQEEATSGGPDDVTATCFRWVNII